MLFLLGNLLGRTQRELEQRVKCVAADLTSQWDRRLAETTSRWEERFATLETTLSMGLGAASETAESISERINKFMELGQVLERSFRRIDEGYDKESPVWQ